MTTWTTTANVTEWTSVEDPSVVFRFVAAATIEGGGGTFDGVHNDLAGRSTAGAHPTSAITGLDAALAAKATPADITDHNESGTAHPDIRALIGNGDVTLVSGTANYTASFGETVVMSHDTGPAFVELPVPSEADDGGWVYVRRGAEMIADLTVDPSSGQFIDTDEGDPIVLTEAGQWAFFVWDYPSTWWSFRGGATGGAVASVNGQTGTVELTLGDLPPRTINIPSDDTITEITATDGVLDYDVALVEPSDGDRGKIALPPLDEWPGQFFEVVALPPTDDDTAAPGPSIGYPAGLPAVLGDFATFTPATLEFAANPATVVWDVNGTPVNALLNEDYADGNALGAALIGPLFGAGVSLTTSYQDRIGERTVNVALITDLTGPTASLGITSAGTGGPGNTSDPLNLVAQIEGTDGDDWYFGYDNDNYGVGELNPVGGFTHAYPDSAELPNRGLRVFNTGTELAPISTAPRWEFVAGAAAVIDGPLDGSNTLHGAIGIINQELKDLAAGGGGASLSDDNPEALGSAAPGTGEEASRSDHVHPVPSASDITTGTLPAGQVPDLAASKITSGTLDDARIPNLAASKTTSGTFDAARIPDLSGTYATTASVATKHAGIVRRHRTGTGVALPYEYTIAATLPWELNTIGNSGAALTSGRLIVVLCPVEIGVPIGRIRAWSGTTAAITPTNQWAGITNKQLVAQRFSADKTTEAWGTSSLKDFTLTTPFTPTEDVVGVMLMVTAGTVPSLRATTLPSVVPAQAFLCDSSLTSPPSLPFTATPGTAATTAPYIELLAP